MVTPISNKSLVSNVLRNIGAINSKLSSSISRLASGKRILKASDDAAGLAISEQLKSDIAALQKGVENVSQGVSLTNIAEGGLQSITSILTEARTLAVQASTGTLSPNQRASIQSQFSSLVSEIDRTVQSTEFNGRKLLSGEFSQSAPPVNIQVGLDGSSSSRVNINVVPDVSSGSLNLTNIDLSTQSGAQNALGAIEEASQEVIDTRGSIGAVQTRFASLASTQRNQIEQLTKATSEISDADFAEEISRLRQTEVSLNSSIQALKQSQFSSQNIGSLLNIKT